MVNIPGRIPACFCVAPYIHRAHAGMHFCSTPVNDAGAARFFPEYKGREFCFVFLAHLKMPDRATRTHDRCYPLALCSNEQHKRRRWLVRSTNP